MTATATLESLAVLHTEKVAPFAIFTASLLDYLDTLELSQVRQVMDIMSLLAYACPSQASVLRDDIHIVLRKQMSFGGTSKGTILSHTDYKVLSHFKLTFFILKTPYISSF